MNDQTFLNGDARRTDLLALARGIYRDRRVRETFFDKQRIFGEPGWDILLDLYIASFDHTNVTVTSACAAANVPVTTALRWLSLLEKDGLVVRSPDARDQRRMFVSLTPRATELMNDCLDQIAENRQRTDRR